MDFEKLLEKRLKEVKSQTNEEVKEARKKQETLIVKTLEPRSDSAFLLFIISFYVPLVLFSQLTISFDIALGTMATMIKALVTAIVVCGSLAYLIFAYFKGLSEKAATSVIELLVKSVRSNMRVLKHVQVLKTSLLLTPTKDYDREEIVERIKKHGMKGLPLYAEMFYGANSPEDDFILVSRGLKPSDLLQEEIAETSGKWGVGLGSLYPANIVEEYCLPTPSTEGREIPVYFLHSNPRTVELFGTVGDKLGDLEPEDFVKAASAAGMFEGLYWKDIALNKEVEIMQKDKVLEASRLQGLRTAAKTLKVLEESRDVLTKKRIFVPSESGESIASLLFNTRAKKIFWSLLGLIIVAVTIYLAVGVIVGGAML